MGLGGILAKYSEKLRLGAISPLWVSLIYLPPGDWGSCPTHSHADSPNGGIFEEKSAESLEMSP